MFSPRTMLLCAGLLVNPLRAQSPHSPTSSVKDESVKSPELPQPKPSEPVRKLFDEANNLAKARDYMGALAVANQALILARETHDAVGEVRAHGEMAMFLQLANQVDQSLTEWEEAAAGWQQLGDGPGRIDALGMAAQLLLLSKPAQAGVLLERAEMLGREERRRPLAAASALDALGGLIYSRGNSEWAKRMIRASLDIRSALIPDSLDVAADLNKLGIVAEKQDDLDAAGKYYRRALSVAHGAAQNSPDEAMSLDSLGGIARKQRHLKAAEQYYVRALTIAEKLAPDSMDLAQRLYILGDVMGQQEDLKAAEQYYVRALTIAEKLAPDSMDLAQRLNILGDVMGQRGDLKGAAEYYRRALAIGQKLEPESKTVAASLNHLGLVAEDQGELKAAKQYYLRALGIEQRAAPESIELATTLNDLGRVTYSAFDLQAAGDFFRAALAIAQKLAPESPTIATSLIHLGLIANGQGNRQDAEQYYFRALGIEEKLSQDSIELAAILTDLGALVSERGNLKSAEEYIQRALAIERKVAPDSIVMAASLNNLGNVADYQGDLRAAREFHHRSLAIKEKLFPDSLAVAISLINLSDLDYEQGDLEAAAGHLRRALHIQMMLTPGSLDMATTLNNLGNVADDQGDVEAAEAYYGQALAIREKMAPDSLDVAASLLNVGILSQKRGDLTAAEGYYQRALSIQGKLAPESLHVAISLSALGRLAHKRGDLNRSSEYERTALAIEENLAPDSLAVADSFQNLAAVARDSGDLESAESLAYRGWSIIKRQGQVVSNDEARRAFGSAKEIYGDLLLSIQLSRGESEAALVTLEEGRAQSLARLLFEKREVLSGASGPLWPRHQEALARFHHAKEVLNKLERVPDRSNLVGQQVENARKEYQHARNEADDLWAEIQKREPRAFVPTMNAADAGKTLGAMAVFVAFSLQTDRAYAFAMQGGETSGVVAEELQLRPAVGRDPSGQIEERVQDLSRQFLGFWLQSKTPPPTSTEAAKAAQRQLVAAGRELFEILFPGEVGEAVRKSKRLIISPDGPLWQLPFAALVMSVDANGNPHYLGEHVAITYTPSLSLYAELKKEVPILKKGQRPVALVVGDPHFDRKVELDPKNPNEDRLWAGLYTRENPPRRLEETQKEAEVVAGLYGSAPMTGDQATETKLRKRIDRADVIHLATHGSFQTALPMSSGVILTPPANEPAIGETGNDGALQAWEIFSQLKLRAELVVLSACETARGEIVRGEGIVGLTRALQYAGARSIVATQWSVAAGESTAKLMEEFHNNLRNGEAKDEALKDAMATVRKKYPHPFFWAPFILLGDPDNLNLGRN